MNPETLYALIPLLFIVFLFLGSGVVRRIRPSLSLRDRYVRQSGSKLFLDPFSNKDPKWFL